MKPKKLPSGNWRVRVLEYTEPNGKRHYRSFTDPDKHTAISMASEFLANHSGKPETYENITVKEACERYIKAKEAVLSPSTVKEYKRIVKNDFQSLMPIQLRKLTAEQVQIAISELSLRVSPKTTRNRHGFLHAAVSMYRPGFVFSTSLPQKEDVECIVPITSEIQAVLEVANEYIRVPILLASQGSLRRSEICALTPDDFTDLGVRVNKAVVSDENGELVTKLPKTDAGNRFCPLPEDVIKEARAWKHFGIKPNALSGYFERARNKASVPKFSFHKLRHYWASELHAQGIPDKYIAEAGGWETVEMLQRIYQHALRDHTSVMTDRIISIFDGNFSKRDMKCDTEVSGA